MKRWYQLFIMIIIYYSALSAQTTGKISGTVKDADSGEALVGANIILVGTHQGAATDLQGDYYIINIIPGNYAIEARMMGYAPMRVENVRVFVNRTIGIDFSLKPEVIEGEVVTVQAEKMSIKKDQTNSIRNISSEDISILPAESVYEVVAMQPGVVGNHFRGGRSNEVTYLIDGVSVTDAFSHEQTTSNVNPEVVEDVEVITGTFNAEYGDAMSGVVNVVTKEGGNSIKGNISLQYGNYLTPHDNVYIGLKAGEFNRISDLKASIVGPLWKSKLFYVVNVRMNQDDGYLNGIRYFNVTDYSDFTPRDVENWHVESSGDSSITDMSWNENISAFAKLTFKPTNNLKLALSGTWNSGEGKSYSHAYRFNPTGVPAWHNETQLAILNINYLLSKAAFIDAKISYSDYWTGYYLYENPLEAAYVHDEYHRNNGPWFYTGGQDKSHSNRTEKKLSGKVDLTWQVSKQHSIKTGFDINQIELSQKAYTIRNAFEGSGIENEYIETPDGKRIYPNYRPIIHSNESIHTDEYQVEPIHGAYFIQDKMEFNMMVVNVGVRFDYFDPQTIYPSNYRNPANQDYYVESERMSIYPEADSKYQVSPRLGLSYDLGGSALLRFAYGHFLQLPPLNYYYQNSTFRIAASDFSTTTGNAQLQPQKTIQYEVGLYQQLSRSMSLEVAVWYKDIYDLVTASVFTTYNQRRYGVFTNKEYGNARGLELKYEFRQDFISAGVNYTLAFTRGIADNPYSSFTRAGSEMDPVNKLIPMNWDQRHTLNLYGGYNTPRWGSTLLCYIDSGQPYTWNPIPQSPLSAINLFPNNEYRPLQFSVDINAYYQIAKIYGMNLRLTLLVYNLFDRLNEEWVNSQTGRAYTAVVQETDILGHRSSFSTYEDVYQNPAMYSSPRMVKCGLNISF